MNMCDIVTIRVSALSFCFIIKGSLTALCLDNGHGLSYTWTSDAATASKVAPPSADAGGGAHANTRVGGGWQKKWRQPDDEIQLKLDTINALFCADLAASLSASSQPHTADGAREGEVPASEDYAISPDELRLVLTGKGAL